MIPLAIPDRPWQKLGSDIFEHKGKPYLVVVDYYSKFIETSLMRDKTAGTIVTHMKPIFARHGIPEELVSDNMPYNSKEFKHFASDWGFKLTTASPTYPQANGLSEKATATGQQYRRNRKDLLQTGEPPPTLSVPEDNDHHTTETDTETQARITLNLIWSFHRTK